MPATKKLTELTPAQQDRMASFAQEWIEYGWRTTPLTEEEWAVWEAGARKCYEYAGIPWPGVVVRVSSPIVGAFAAPIAGKMLDDIAKGDKSVWDSVGDSVWASVGDSVGASVWDSVWDSVGASVWDSVGASVGASVGDSVGDSVGASVWDSVWASVGASVWASVGASVGDSVGASVWDSVWASVGASVWASVGASVRASVGASVWASVWDSVGASVRANWSKRLGGRDWCEYSAFYAYFRDVVELQLDQGVWDKARAYEDSMSAGWWWPTRAFVMVCDLPSTLHIESAGGRDRLHCETGPAVAWADGWGVYSWHGTRVPADLIENDWDVEKIMAETNTEIRRCAIEKMGWDRFVTAADMKLVDETNDPGNPGQKLRLYDVPRKVLDLPVRVLVATNATPERNGERHTFGLTTPTDCRTAIAAAAWTFGLTEREYKELARAT